MMLLEVENLDPIGREAVLMWMVNIKTMKQAPGVDLVILIPLLVKI